MLISEPVVGVAVSSLDWIISFCLLLQHSFAADIVIAANTNAFKLKNVLKNEKYHSESPKRNALVTEMYLKLSLSFQRIYGFAKVLYLVPWLKRCLKLNGLYSGINWYTK